MNLVHEGQFEVSLIDWKWWSFRTGHKISDFIGIAFVGGP